MSPVVAGFPREKRTDRILSAVRTALARQAESLNHPSLPVRGITVSVKMNTSSGEPRAVVLTIETETTT